MTEQLPQRPRRTVRSRLLSVTGLAVMVTVIGSLLIWHAQLGEFFSPTADKEPVISAQIAPAVSIPPSATVKAEITPTPTPTHSPKPEPKATTSPKPKPKPTTAPTAEYGEESINGLSPKLKSRLKKAMVAARADGVTIRINSARRSAAKQQRLLNEAIKKYGSYREATRWVLPPSKSAHVQGKAVDIKPAAAMQWLDKNGWRYGVCRRYDNEPWHFEALTTPGTKCPPREASSTAHK
ncbi:D-alanyl-D-alanine carboxypeptidase family protein [Kribbella sp. NPDC051587]|uniref:M15 family metallopeptidase n=1 Tax=Kribbella sp. NPDC051587 TaxID=3364119 RepID=UPI003798B346